MVRTPKVSGDEGSARLATLCATRLLAVIPRLLGPLRGCIAAEPAGLSLPRFRLLACLVHHPGISLSAVAGDLCIGLPTLSAMVEDLRRAGLVGRSDDARDRRRSVLRTTRAGTRAFRRAETALAEHLALRLRCLGPDDLELVATALDRLLSAAATPLPRSDPP